MANSLRKEPYGKLLVTRSTKTLMLHIRALQFTETNILRSHYPMIQ
uniref:Uncharacterized protein n=1 Tax=Rhizophora mucronata TaxID=61149 RepID=A0A2P2PPW1_RHIMU